jgi:hypothetical protein
VFVTNTTQFNIPAFTPVSEWYNKAYDFGQAEYVDVRAPETVRNVDFVLEQGGYIACRVVDPGGQQLRSGVMLYAYPSAGEEVRSTRVSYDGNYYLAGLKTDDYKVLCRYSEGGVTSIEWYDGQPSREGASILNVTAPSGNRSIDLTLEHPATLQGFVSDKQDNRLTSSDHLVTVYVYDAETGHFVIGSSTSFAGGFQSTLLGRSYKVAALSVYWNWMENQDSLAATYYPTGGSFSDVGATTIALGQESVVTLNDFAMERTGGGIKGTVYDADAGAPVTSGTYFLVAVDKDGFIATASGYTDLMSSVTGQYRLMGLRPGTYFVLAMIAPQSLAYKCAQWHEGVDVPISTVLSATKLLPPANARAIVVGEGMTSGVDVHFSLTTGVSRDSSLIVPRAYSLHQNYPNPFNPSTTIEFALPHSGFVTLKVYNVLGEEVANLVGGNHAAGRFKATWDASSMPSGVYFYRLIVGQFSNVRKMILMR